jgi:hypothetical protein
MYGDGHTAAELTGHAERLMATHPTATRGVIGRRL